MSDQEKEQEPRAEEETGALIRQRQKKVEEIRAAGGNPYRNDFQPAQTAAELQRRFAGVTAAPVEGGARIREGLDGPPPRRSESAGAPLQPLSEERFAIAGRIVEHRSFGKAAFVKLLDRSGRIQVYLRKDVVGEAAYAEFKRAESWDFLGVRGFAFHTKTGELTLLAEQVSLLTKAVRPPPEKWSGLKDQETRYRQRYLDLVANPEVAEVFRKRSRIIRLMRAYFDERDFLEVETPLLHPILGGAAARPFRTHHNALDMPLYLRIAPELYLKRLVVGGFDRVYEIGRNFRNEGLSRKHNPEFTMIEFYMGYATYQTLIGLTEELIALLAQEVCGGTRIVYQGQPVDLTPPWPRIPVAEAVRRAVAAEGIAPLEDAALSDPEQLAAWCQRSGLQAREDLLGEGLRRADSHGKRIGVLFDALGEKHLPHDRPVFVVDYPAATSPLSRRKDADPELVDRFELFIVGREHANAFSELNDPADQRGRFQDQLRERERGDEEAMEYDEDYCRALEYGMPPTAGEGIGIDRLAMLLADQASIRDVILFPHMRPELR